MDDEELRQAAEQLVRALLGRVSIYRLRKVLKVMIEEEDFILICSQSNADTCSVREMATENKELRKSIQETVIENRRLLESNIQLRAERDRLQVEVDMWENVAEAVKADRLRRADA